MSDINGASNFGSVTTQKPPLVCKICFSTENIRRCSGCHKVLYCGSDCQRIDWPMHRMNCYKLQHQSQVPQAPQVTSQIQNSDVQAIDQESDLQLIESILFGDGMSSSQQAQESGCSSSSCSSTNIQTAEQSPIQSNNVENDFDTQTLEELNELLFGTGLSGLQFDDSVQSQLSFGQENTMQLTNQNIYNNSELNQFR